MFELRPYQTRATDAAKDFLRQSVEPCLIDAAPAAGKSFCVAEMARWFREISGGKRVLCLQPNAKLCKQNVEKFQMTGEQCSVFSASAGAKSTRHGVVYATPTTVKNAISRFTKGDFCAVIVDEAHGYTPTIRAIIEEMRLANPNLRVLGLTGTPYRMNKGYIFLIHPDGKVNGDDVSRDPPFTQLVYRVSAHEMLDGGYITPMEVRPINDESVYDVSGIELLPNGTLNHSTVEQAFEGHGRRTAACIRDIMAQVHALDVKGGVMIFAATVRHAQEIMASLPPGNSAISTGDHGILMGREASDDEIIKAYRAQKFRYLVSVAKYCIGFDVDHTEFIALLRYSESPDLTEQILGRAWRLHPEKPKCYVADFAGNLERHFPDGDLYNPTIKVKGKSTPGQPIEAECPDCGYLNEFNLHPDYADFARDKHGYCLDVFGAPLMSEYGPVAAHYGRRCFGMVRTGAKGEYERCGYRYGGKECEACGELNDISARQCYVCKNEIVDPNRVLVSEFVAQKRDPTVPQTDKVLSLEWRESTSQKGNTTIRADFVTPYRQFSCWFLAEPKNAKQASDLRKFEEATAHGPPETVSYCREKESSFYRIIGYNHPCDDDAANPDAIEATAKLRRYG